METHFFAKIIYLKVFLFMVWLFIGNPLIYASNLRLPSIISTNMVLQQETTITIWGWANAKDSISIRVGWSETPEYCFADSEGKWNLDLLTPEAGGPFEINIEATDTTIILKNVMVGEVWVCSGQSNMEMPFNGYLSMPVIGSNDYIAHGTNDNIRLFTVEKSPSISPAFNCGGNWRISNPSNVSEFSAIAYVFGKYIQEILGIPVGLILSAWGNTPAEAWTDKATLKSNFKEIDLSVLRTDSFTFQSPSVLFNGMISPILNYKIRGVIWYQGTNNRKRPEQYAKLFPAMIRSWREHWKLPDLPFYFVQNAPYSFRYDINMQSAFLREAQLKTMRDTPNTGMVVTMDVGDSLSNHPSEKIIVGKRLAYWALAKTYGLEGLSYSGPIFKSMKIADGKAILTFDYAEFGLTSFGKRLEHFVIAGQDKHFIPANAEILDTNLIVWNKNLKNPVAVRYCWENYAEGTLFNNAGLPASSFRTDNWDK